jgi:hypothetical protein
MKTLARRLMLLALLLAASCASPDHLQKDFGTSYYRAFATQADLSRPAAAEQAYPLTGQEALQIRQQAEQQTTDEALAIPVLVPTSGKR